MFAKCFKGTSEKCEYLPSVAPPETAVKRTDSNGSFYSVFPAGATPVDRVSGGACCSVEFPNDWPSPQEPYYHGKISREEGEELLKSYPKPGAFLVRFGLNAKRPVVSYIKEVDAETGALKVTHEKFIRLTEDKYMARNGDNKNFSSLLALVETYKLRGVLSTAVLAKKT